ncbi:SulP family inorganic anion transporter [Aeromicrobium sp. UC242_57]
MAYATIAELPVQYGLYTCMVPMVVYAFLGGSRAMSVSTTSTIAVLTASTMATAGIAAGSDDGVTALSTVNCSSACSWWPAGSCGWAGSSRTSHRPR